MRRLFTYLLTFIAGELLGYFAFPGFTYDHALCLISRRAPGELAISLVIFNLALVVIASLYVYLRERE